MLENEKYILEGLGFRGGSDDEENVAWTIIVMVDLPLLVWAGHVLSSDHRQLKVLCVSC